MPNDKGRGLPRIHALYGPTDPQKERKFRCCVQGELNDTDFKQFTNEMLNYLESTLSSAQRTGTVDPGAHSTRVRFALGKKHVDLGIQSIDVSINDLKTGNTEKLRKRFDDAIIAARNRVENDRAHREAA